MARLIALVLLMPASAMADPITLVASLAPIVGSTAAGFIVSYGAYIAVGALQVLGSASAKRKQRRAAARQRAEYNASLQDRNVTGLSAEAPWQIVYGSPAPVGGSLVAILTSGDRDQYKHLVIVFAAHECEAIDEIYIEGEPVGALDGAGWCTGGVFYEAQEDLARSEVVTFDAFGNGTVSQPMVLLLSVSVPVTGDERVSSEQVPATGSGTSISAPAAAGLTVTVSYTYAHGTGRVNVQKHLSPGGVDTADAFLMAAAPAFWTSAHKLSGYTYAVVTLDLNMPRFQGGPPNISAKMRGKKLYDPRTATTSYSANNTLCAQDYLRSEYGFGAALAQIDAAASIVAANACDAQGYTCHGVLSTGSDRDGNLQQIEDSMAGSTHFSGGVWRIIAGAWASPIMALNDAHLAGRIEVAQASEPAEKRYNGARGRYVPASDLGVAADITPYSNATYLAEDGIARVQDMEFPLTATHAQCQKLAIIATARSRLGLTINYPADLRAWSLQPGDRVTVTNAEFGFVAKPFRLVDWTFHASAPVGLVLTEDAVSVWTGTSSAVDPTRATSNLVDPWARPAAPEGLAASSGTADLLKAADGSIITRVRLSWTPPTSRAVLQGGYTQVQWRLATEGAEWQSQDLPADAASQYLLGLQDGTVILARARFVTGLQALGDWSTISHFVTGKTEPPPDVETFLIDGDVLSWSYTPPLDLAGFELRFNYGSNTWWDSATPLHEGFITDNPYTLQRRPAGTITLLIKAVDTSGNRSLNALSIVVDLGDIETRNVLLTWPQAPSFADGVLTGGAVVSGELEADALDEFFSPGDGPLFTPGTEDFFPAGLYAEMQYTWAVTPSAAGLLLLEHEVAASSYRIEYLRGDQGAMFTPATDEMFGPADEPMFGAAPAWAVWPGSLTVDGIEQIGFRITTAGGDVQGVVSVATAILDVPDIVERVSDQAISAGGTRLALVQGYREIVNVMLTVQADGGGGITARTEDKDAALGPLVRVFDASGTAVAGLIDATVQGY